MKKHDRYYSYKPKTTTIAVTIDVHDALKAFAAARDYSMKDAVEYLLKKAILAEYNV
jgi:hypothetical protein